MSWTSFIQTNNYLLTSYSTNCKNCCGGCNTIVAITVSSLPQRLYRLLRLPLPDQDFRPLAVKCTVCRGWRVFLESERPVTPVQLYGIVCQLPSRPQQTTSFYRLLKTHLFNLAFHIPHSFIMFGSRCWIHKQWLLHKIQNKTEYTNWTKSH